MLAEALGMTVGELLQRISSREIAEWKAYFKLRNEEAERRQRRGGRVLGG